MNGPGIDIEGRFVMIRPTYHKPEYREPQHLLFKAEGGFGCRPDTIGTAVIGYYPIDGERCRIEGPVVERLATDDEIAAVFRIRRERALASEGIDFDFCPGCGWQQRTADTEPHDPTTCPYLIWEEAEAVRKLRADILAEEAVR